MEVQMEFSPGVSIKFSCAGTAELLARLADVQAIRPEPCGLCGKEEIILASRMSKKGTPFLRYVCVNCKAQLRIASPANMTPWIDRNDQESRQPLPNRGWHHYVPQQQANTAYSQPASDEQATAADPNIPF